MRARRIIPPIYFYLCLLAMVPLHFALPVIHILDSPWRLVGIVPVAVGVALSVVADSAFKHVGTTVQPLEQSTTLVTTGTFRISRHHPMYLGFVLVLLGAAMLFGSLTPFVVVAAFAVFIDAVFVRFEESKMEDQFGDAWREYKRKVRRWL